MAIENLHRFLENYFTAHHCQQKNNKDGVLTVQLTETMDRALMNRPFYWHYIKKIGQKGEPMMLTLITNPEKRNEKGEWIHFGSPRLQQIINHLFTSEKYSRLFQRINSGTTTALYPWLVTNIKISYQGKQKKDEIVSIGLHLVNGTMRINMMDLLETVPLQMSISDYCYTISPIIKWKSGFQRIEVVLENHIKSQSHEWAKESLENLDEEIELAKHFYSGETNDDTAADIAEQMEKEIQEIHKRYEPCITFEVINGGLFYLSRDV